MDTWIKLLGLFCCYAKDQNKIWDENAHVFSSIIFRRIEQRRIVKPVRVIGYDELEHYFMQNIHLVYRLKLEFDINLDLELIGELIVDHMPTNSIEKINFEYKFYQIEGVDQFCQKMIAKGVNLGRLKLDYLNNNEEVSLIQRSYVDLFRQQKSVGNTHIIPKYIREFNLFYLNSNYTSEELDQISSIHGVLSSKYSLSMIHQNGFSDGKVWSTVEGYVTKLSSKDFAFEDYNREELQIIVKTFPNLKVVDITDSSLGSKKFGVILSILADRGLYVKIQNIFTRSWGRKGDIKMTEADLFMVDKHDELQYQYYGDLIEVIGGSHEFYSDLNIANLKMIRNIEFKNLKKSTKKFDIFERIDSTENLREKNDPKHEYFPVIGKEVWISYRFAEDLSCRK